MLLTARPHRTKVIQLAFLSKNNLSIFLFYPMEALADLHFAPITGVCA
jgi:hypothetical protein